MCFTLSFVVLVSSVVLVVVVVVIVDSVVGSNKNNHGATFCGVGAQSAAFVVVDSAHDATNE
jgi:hypothetical protein